MAVENIPDDSLHVLGLWKNDWHGVCSGMVVHSKNSLKQIKPIADNSVKCNADLFFQTNKPNKF